MADAASAPVVPTRVLRAGPPEGPKGRADAVIGVLGLLLLVAAGAAIAVPDILRPNPVVPLQYRITVHPIPGGIKSVLHNFTEDDPSHDFLVEVPTDNVYVIDFTVGFREDEAATERDSFRIDLLDHRGELLLQNQILSNAEPTRLNPPIQGFAPEFQSVTTTMSPHVTYRARLEDRIVDALSQEETPEQVHDRLMAEYGHSSAGTWTVRVTLLSTGDCPMPDPSRPHMADRVAACRRFHPAAPPEEADVGNEFGLYSFIYTSFELQVEELET